MRERLKNHRRKEEYRKNDDCSVDKIRSGNCCSPGDVFVFVRQDQRAYSIYRGVESTSHLSGFIVLILLRLVNYPSLGLYCSASSRSALIGCAKY